MFNGLGTNDKLRLDFSDGTSQDIIGFDILNGGQVIGLPNNEIPDPPDDWGRVSYDMNNGNSIVKATFSSGSGFWYIDSIAFAAPEASTWAMLILGFGLAGWQLRVRRRNTKLASLERELMPGRLTAYHGEPAHEHNLGFCHTRHIRGIDLLSCSARWMRSRQPIPNVAVPCGRSWLRSH